MSILSASRISDATDAIRPARFSVAQFDQMIRGGVFDEAGGRRFELVRGGVLTMVPPNPPHDHVVSLLHAWATDRRRAGPVTYDVRSQCGMDFIDQDSVTLPDVALVEARSYWSVRPTAAQTMLLIEVADSTLRYDLNEKMELYAEAGVGEYWVVDIPHRSLIVHRGPGDRRYRRVTTHGESEAIAAERLPQMPLAVAGLLGPA